MKTLRIFPLMAIFMAIASISIGQKTTTETFKVSGNCGMCKSNIEKAAKNAGAKEATWNKESKMLVVKYSSSLTNAAKIQQKIADVGYDNVGFKATDEAYNKLHSCCKYVREATASTMECCKEGKCTMVGHNGMDCCKKGDAKMDCCKDGKCTMPGHDGKDCCKKAEGKCTMAGHDGMDCCKKGDAKMDCCKDGKCTMPGHDGKDCCKKGEAKMDCCKDGKCSMPGHDGKDCCKKS